MKTFYMAGLVLFPVFVFANGTESKQEINSPVKSVILYLSAAEVTHQAQVNLNAGRNRIIFTGLSARLVSKSVQVNVPDEVSILSVSDKLDYLAKQQESPRIKQLKDSSEMLSNSSRTLQNEKDAYQTEKNMLVANQYIGGQNTGVALPALKASADFFLERMKEINGEMYKLDKKQEKVTEQLSKIKQELAELNAKFNQPGAEVTVLLTSSLKTSIQVTLKYVVNSAGWAPIYDLRAADIDKPIELKYRANAFNNTGVDWNDVKLKLSTADPMQSASQPRMETWFLDYEQNLTRYWNDGLSRMDSSKDMDGYLNTRPGIAEGKYSVNTQRQEAIVKDNVKFGQIQVSELSAEFDIKIPYSIPADSKPYLVDVTTYNLPASYRHFSVPKLDRDAFLLASITGWEDLDLVEGTANVYYGGTFIGQSYIYTRTTNDTLDLSLGRDRKVLVTRVKQKDLTSTKYIGTNKKELHSFEITVKNNRKTAVSIELEDQIPISKQGDITVETIETSKGEFDPVTGKLKWNLSLQPDESRKILLSFAIKYPKNRSVAKQKFRTVAAPSF